MKVYRGTRDVLPHELDHRKISPAVFGEATYFALTASAAEFYAQGGFSNCAVVTTYELPAGNFLLIQAHEWSKIHCVADAKIALPINPSLQEKLDYQNPQLAPVHLAKVIKQSGFDGAILQGSIEGGEQIVLPDNSIHPTVLSYQVKLAKSMLGHSKVGDVVTDFKHLLNNQDIALTEDSYYFFFNLTPSQLINLTPTFELMKVLKDRYFYQINILTGEIIRYDDDL